MWTRVHYRMTWEILAALTQDRSSREKIEASPTGALHCHDEKQQFFWLPGSAGAIKPGLSGSYSAEVLPVSWLAASCFSESQRFLDHSPQCVPSKILSPWASASHSYCWVLIQEELTSRKSLLFLERYHWDASCLANVRMCCVSWLFWTVCSIAMEETSALVSVVVSGCGPDPSLDLAARWCWNGCKGGRNPQLGGQVAGTPHGPQWGCRVSQPEGV